MSESGTAPNQYRVRLGLALPRARMHAEAISSAFTSVRRAMDGGAWDSPLATAFASVCREKELSAGNAAEGCVDQLEGRHRVEPVHVDAADRRARLR